MREWISVKAQMPDLSARVPIKERTPAVYARVHGPDNLVSDILLLYSEKEGVLIGFFEDYGETFDWVAIQIKDNILVTDISHWMPLPGRPD